MPVTPLDALRALSRASGTTLQHLDTRRAVRRSLSNETNLRGYVLWVMNAVVERTARSLVETEEEAQKLLDALREEMQNEKPA